MRMLNWLRKNRNNRPKAKTQYVDVGFHGDRYLIEFIFECLNKSNNFIETGTNVGSTLSYVVQNYPNINCFSCEPYKPSYDFAKEKMKNKAKVKIYNRTSPEFFEDLIKDSLDIFRETSAFWLDSHGYGFRWPLREEVKYITEKFSSGFIFIDDFQVPGQPQFLYDEYEGQICSFEYIEPSLAPGNYSIYYPNYKDRTSDHHPLKGWALIEFGTNTNDLIPLNLSNKIDKIAYVKAKK